MDLYIDGEEAPIDVNSETEGFYLRINDPGDTAVPFGTNEETINIAHSGFSYTSSGYEKLIAEIYRPKKDLDEDLMVYYEIGDKIPIKSLAKVPELPKFNCKFFFANNEPKPFP